MQKTSKSMIYKHRIVNKLFQVSRKCQWNEPSTIDIFLPLCYMIVWFRIQIIQDDITEICQLQTKKYINNIAMIPAYISHNYKQPLDNKTLWKENVMLNKYSQGLTGIRTHDHRALSFHWVD